MISHSDPTYQPGQPRGYYNRWQPPIMGKARTVLPLLLLLSGCALAQETTGKITGTVTDASDAVVVNAKVTVTNIATGLSKTVATDSSGTYQGISLPIGSYKVTATAPGFATTTVVAAKSLGINETLRVDVRLNVGQQTDSLTVSDTAGKVETENPTIGGTVIGEAIQELPLNGRDTLDLLMTLPGITISNPDSDAAGNYSIGGQRTDSVTYLLDGGLNNDLLDNSAVADPNPDAVAEFRVLESNYSAEYGRNAGGIVSVVTKSGTNSLHGSAFDYLRNNDLDANRFFNNQQGLPVPVLKRNQYGVTIGGPIVIPKLFNGRNKLFFFFSWQGQRQTSLDTSPGKVTTLTPLEAEGNFSLSSDKSLVAAYLLSNPYYQGNPRLASQGIINPTRLDPVAEAYLKNNLIPTSSTGFLFPQAKAVSNADEFLGKYDYNISTHDQLSGTFTSWGNTQLNPFDTADVVGYPDYNESDTYFGSISWTHTFTPTLLNSARFTAQRTDTFQGYPAASLPGPQQLGINITPDQTTGPSIISLQGSNLTVGFGNQGPTSLIDNTFAFDDNLSWIKGAHSIKAGFFFSPFQSNIVYDFYVNGAFFFYGPSTYVGSGLDLADFLMGLPDEFLQFGKAPSSIRSKQYATYVQDAWKARKNLTLTFGVRYEYAQPKFDTQGRTFSFIPGLQSQRFPNAPPGLVFPGDHGAPTGVNFPDKNNWAPRFGFAWDVFGDGKTSLRGGGGLFYDILKAEDNLQFNGQEPFYGFADIFPASPDYGEPGLGLQDPYGAAGATNPFPSKPPASNINFAQEGLLPYGGSGVFFVDPHLRTPYVFHYNLSLQRELTKGIVFEASYIGYAAHDLTGIVDINPFVLGTNTRLYNVGVDPNNPNYSFMDEFTNSGSANYNSMVLSLRKDFASTGNLGKSFFTLGYTWSHEIDNESGFRQRNGSVPYYDSQEFRASGDTDLRSALVFSGGWELPFDHLWSKGPKLLTSGWALYPILTVRTGFTLDVVAGLNTTPTDPGPSGAGDAGSVRADLVGSSVGILNPATYQTIAGNSGNYWFNPGNFSNARLLQLDQIAQTNAAQLPYFTYGSFPRNGMRGPGSTNLDIAFAKHFRLKEGKIDLELRGDAFNVFNHTQFANPDTNINDATFGQISNTADPRILQIALHLKY
jgi:Carboxypeptidase regulatory-like domain/TonB-dependent Receptor Plug Domain/TonB dependent receptor